MPPVPAAVAEPRRTARHQPWLAAGAAAVLALLAGLWWALQPALRIDDVRSAQPVMVGDGRPQPVVLSYDSRNTRPKHIEVRWVEGSARWPAASWQVPVNPDARAAGEISAGPLSYRTAAPSNATFEYTLLDAEGRRSAPVQKRFEFLPPVTVTGVRFPAPPKAGHSTSALVAYTRGAGDIVSVQHRVIDSTTPWVVAEQTTALAPTLPQGRVDLPLTPPALAARSTLEVVLVDSLGVKSEPFVFNLNTGLQPMVSGPALVVSVVQTQAGGTTGVGAVAGGVVGGTAGNQLVKGSGRAVATLLGAVGGAAAGNAIESHIRGPALWATTVRFDDGNTRHLQHSAAPHWRTGERVNVSASGQVSR
jgi:outer membrane lipoprotein SlyB